MWISYHLSCDFILNLPLFLTQTKIYILCTTRFCTVTWIVPLGVLSGTHPVEFGHNVKKPVVAVMGFFVFLSHIYVLSQLLTWQLKMSYAQLQGDKRTVQKHKNISQPLKTWLLDTMFTLWFVMFKCRGKTWSTLNPVYSYSSGFMDCKLVWAFKLLSVDVSGASYQTVTPTKNSLSKMSSYLALVRV